MLTGRGVHAWHRANLQHAFFGACSTAWHARGRAGLGSRGQCGLWPRWRGDNGSGEAMRCQGRNSAHSTMHVAKRRDSAILVMFAIALARCHSRRDKESLALSMKEDLCRVALALNSTRQERWKASQHPSRARYRVCRLGLVIARYRR